MAWISVDLYTFSTGSLILSTFVHRYCGQNGGLLGTYQHITDLEVGLQFDLTGEEIN
ncbi:MAG: hypothetical protein RI981_366 [Bacteroidota bacterium]|jgi:hypothetical protein